LFDDPLEQPTHAAEELIETPRFKARSGREEAIHTLARDLIDAGNALLGEKSIEQPQRTFLGVEAAAEGSLDFEIAHDCIGERRPLSA